MAKVSKNKIVLEWALFGQQTVFGDDHKDTAYDINFAEFGEAMAKVIGKYGVAESNLWEGVLPSGTEDRTWVRTWLYMQGNENYQGMIKSLDGAHAKRILAKFKAVGIKDQSKPARKPKKENGTQDFIDACVQMVSEIYSDTRALFAQTGERYTDNKMIIALAEGAMEQVEFRNLCQLPKNANSLKVEKAVRKAIKKSYF